MPYPTPASTEDRALPVVPLDYENGVRRVMSGAAITVGPFPNNGDGFAVVKVQNTSPTEIIWLRGDGLATTGDDDFSIAIFPLSEEPVYVYHTGRTISVLGPSGAVVKAIPYLSAA
jgi:hypothetical protein